MRRRNNSIELFSLSFLDVLTCALGGVLLLLFLTMNRRTEEASAAQSRAQALQQQVDDTTAQLQSVTETLTADNARLQSAREDLERAKKALQDAQQTGSKKLADLERTLEKAQSEFQQENQKRLTELQQLHATLIGLKGDLRHVVFVFDTSGSMNTPRFAEYTGLLESWVQKLNFENFNVVRFDSKVMAWSPSGTRPATPESRREAVQFIHNFKPDGDTFTQAAFQEAFRDPQTKTIVFFSDGAPTDAHFDQILSWLDKANGQRKVTINTVGMGNYFNQAYGQFLKTIAERHGGVFIGR